MLNEEMREAIKTARTYNRTTKARESWSRKVDKMPVEQVFEVYQRLNHCMHVYFVPTHVDGYPLGFYDTGKQWTYDQATYGSRTKKRNLEAQFIEDHPEYANSDIHYVYLEELPKNDAQYKEFEIGVKCNTISSFKLEMLAKYKGLKTEQPKPWFIIIYGDALKITELLINNGLKPNEDGQYHMIDHSQVEL